MKRPIPAVGYVRRSTDKQEASLEDQRREIERYATANGYTVIRWYTDDAISGDETERRAGFLAMHKAACNGRDFACIIVWDQDRFGRFKSTEAGYWIHPLMKAGVYLVTVNDGRISWDDLNGRLMYLLKQENKYQFLVDLSKNVSRGMISNARAGWLNGQAAPYGFDRVEVDGRGNVVRILQPGQRSNRDCNVTLAPSEDKEKVRWARWMFETYDSEDVGCRTLADRLNEKGVPGPTGGKWFGATIRAILRNYAYCGDYVWARRREGKYHRVAGDNIQPRTETATTASGNVRAADNPREEWHVKEDAFPAIVDRKTWERVQVKMRRRRERTSPNRKRNPDAFLLSGLVYCGHCGHRMHGETGSRKKGGKVYRYPKFVCSGYQRSTTICHHHTVHQAGLVKCVLRLLKEQVFLGGHRDELKARIKAKLTARQQADPADIQQLRNRIAQLDKDLTDGTKRLLKCPEDVVTLLAGELSGLRKDRDRLQGELAALERASEPLDAESLAETYVGQLDTLADELEKAPPARLRELLGRMVSRIDLWFDHEQKAKRVDSRFSKGLLETRPDPMLLGLDNRGDRT